MEAGLAQRARIVLLAAEGLPNAEIARRVGMTRPTVIQWRNRYVSGGIAALGDLDRSGRPPVIDDAAVVIATLQSPPESLGVTHWSARLLGKHLGISFASVARIWRDWNLQPWRQETFKFSTDPELDAKVRDVVGLYLNPPDKAVVVCIDEKTQVQALDRTAPILPMRPGLPEKATHDYIRHGTTSLFAAFNIADGTVISELHRRHRATEFRKFLARIDKAVPADLDVHLVCDNYATRKTATIQDWLARHPRFHLHFTPTGSSWINQVERWSGYLTDQMIRRGVHKSVQALEADIRAWIENWNQDPRPFTWTKTAEEILDSLARYISRISGAAH